MSIKINNQLKTILNAIHNNGGDVYFVGGCVRDSLLNRKNKDIDLEIHNISVDKVESILKKFGKLDLVGKSFGILKVEGINIDFAFPRKDNLIGAKHTSFEVTVDPFLSLIDSAKRRDFTMNAIMENAITGEIIDPFNGITDLKNYLIKIVDKNTFSEDPLRVLRAAQFASRLNFNVDSEVIKIGNQLNFKNLSTERIETELHKGMMSNQPSRMLTILKQSGVFAQLSPDIDKLNTVEQSKIWHPEGNVWKHTLKVVDMGGSSKR